MSSEPIPTPAQAAKSEAARQAVILAFAAATVLLFMAVQKPDFLKTSRMRLAAGSSRLLAWAARRSGHDSMGIELMTGARQYSIPYALSRLRDTAAQVYTRETEHGS